VKDKRHGLPNMRANNQFNGLKICYEPGYRSCVHAAGTRTVKTSHISPVISMLICISYTYASAKTNLLLTTIAILKNLISQ
jgi:hypothetical protein